MCLFVSGMRIVLCRLYVGYVFCFNRLVLSHWIKTFSNDCAHISHMFSVSGSVSCFSDFWNPNVYLVIFKLLTLDFFQPVLFLDLFRYPCVFSCILSQTSLCFQLARPTHT